MKKQPQPVEIQGKPLNCKFCNNTTFNTIKTVTSKRAFAFFDLEWLGKSGTAYICSQCGYKHEFLK